MINQKNDPNLLYLPKSFEKSTVESVDKVETESTKKVDDVINDLNSRIDSVVTEIDEKISIIDNTVTEVTKDLNNKAVLIDNYDMLSSSAVTPLMGANTVHPEIQQVFESNKMAENLFKSNKFLNTKLYERLYESIDSVTGESIPYMNTSEWQDVKYRADITIEDEKSYQVISIPVNTSENIKVLDFVLNYKQKPEGVGNYIEIHRNIEGRIYILRDTDGSLIIKSSIKNSDNEVYMKENKIWDNVTQSFIETDGPEFNLEFFISGENILMVIKDFTPYRYHVSKTVNNIDVSDEFANDFLELSYNDVFEPYTEDQLDKVRTIIDCDFFIMDKIGHLYNSDSTIIEKTFISETGYNAYITNPSIIISKYKLMVNKKGLVSYDLPLVEYHIDNTDVKSNDIIKYTFTNFEKLSDGSYKKIASIEDIRQQILDVLYDYYKDDETMVEKLFYDKELENEDNFALCTRELLYTRTATTIFSNTVETPYGLLTYAGSGSILKLINKETKSITDISIPSLTIQSNTYYLRLYYHEETGILSISAINLTFNNDPYAGISRSSNLYGNVYIFNGLSLTVLTRPSPGSIILFKEIIKFNDKLFCLIDSYISDVTDSNMANYINSNIRGIVADVSTVYIFNPEEKTFTNTNIQYSPSISPENIINAQFLIKNDILYLIIDYLIYKYNSETGEFHELLNINDYVPDSYTDPFSGTVYDLTDNKTGNRYSINYTYDEDDLILFSVSYLNPGSLVVTDAYFNNVFKFDLETETVSQVNVSENLYNISPTEDIFSIHTIKKHSEYGILCYTYRNISIGNRFDDGTGLEYSMNIYNNNVPLFSNLSTPSILKYDPETNTLDFFSNALVDPYHGFIETQMGTFATDLLTKDIYKVRNITSSNMIKFKSRSEKPTVEFIENIVLTKTNLTNEFVYAKTSNVVDKQLSIRNNFNNYAIFDNDDGVLIIRNNELWFLQNESSLKFTRAVGEQYNGSAIATGEEFINSVLETNLGVIKSTTIDFSKNSGNQVLLQISRDGEYFNGYDVANNYNQIPLHTPNLNEYSIKKIKETSAGIIYMSNNEINIMLPFDDSAFQYRAQNIVDLSTSAGKFINDIEEYDNKIFFITPDTLYYIDKYYPTIPNTIADVFTWSSNPTNQYTTIKSTRNGLYLGTGNGLYKYDSDENKFNYYNFENTGIICIHENPYNFTKILVRTEFVSSTTANSTVISRIIYTILYENGEYIDFHNIYIPNGTVSQMYYFQHTFKRKMEKSFSYIGERLILPLMMYNEEYTEESLLSEYVEHLYELKNDGSFELFYEMDWGPFPVPGQVTSSGLINMFTGSLIYSEFCPIFLKETTQGLLLVKYSLISVVLPSGVTAFIDLYKQSIEKYNYTENKFEYFDEIPITYEDARILSYDKAFYTDLVETSQGIFLLDDYNFYRPNQTGNWSSGDIPTISPAMYLPSKTTNFKTYKHTSKGIQPPINWQKYKLRGNNLSNRFGHKAYISANTYLDLNTLQQVNVLTDTPLLTETDSFDFSDIYAKIYYEYRYNLFLSNSVHSNYLSHFMSTDKGVLALEVLDVYCINPDNYDYTNYFNWSLPVNLYFNNDPLNTNIFKKVQIEFSEDITGYEDVVDTLFKIIKEKNIVFSDEFVKGFWNTKNGLFYGKRSDFLLSPLANENTLPYYPERNMTVWKFDETKNVLKQYILTLPEVMEWKRYSIIMKDMLGKTYCIVTMMDTFNVLIYEYNSKYDTFNFIVNMGAPNIDIDSTKYVYGLDFYDSIIGFDNKIFINYFNTEYGDLVKLPGPFRSYDLKTKEIKIFEESEDIDTLHQFSVPPKFFIYNNELYCGKMESRAFKENNTVNTLMNSSQLDYILKYDKNTEQFSRSYDTISMYMDFIETDFGNLIFNNNIDNNKLCSGHFGNSLIGTNSYRSGRTYDRVKYTQHSRYSLSMTDSKDQLGNMYRTNYLTQYIPSVLNQYISNHDVRYGYDSNGEPYLYVIVYNDLYNVYDYKFNDPNVIKYNNGYAAGYNKISTILKFNPDTRLFETINDTDFGSTYGNGNRDIEYEINTEAIYNTNANFFKYPDNACTENFYVFDGLELWVNSVTYPYHNIQFRKPYIVNKKTENAERFNGYYNLTLTGLNQEEYNNLDDFDTDFSNIDKLVIKENGSLHILDTKSGVTDNNYIKQYFDFKNYYPYTKNMLLPENRQSDLSTYLHKEDYNISNIKSYIKNIVYGHERSTLFNRRFIKDNSLLTNSLSHKTNTVLGDLEHIIKDNIVFKVDMEIYPFSTSDTNGYEDRFKWFTEGYHPDRFFNWYHGN